MKKILQKSRLWIAATIGLMFGAVASAQEETALELVTIELNNLSAELVDTFIAILPGALGLLAVGFGVIWLIRRWKSTAR